MKIIKTGNLPWIDNNEFICSSDQIPTEIVGVTKCGSNILFTNYEDYKQFSAVFKYKFDVSTLCFEKIKIKDKYLPVLCNCDSERYLATTNICDTLLLCKDSEFVLVDVVTGKPKQLINFNCMLNTVKFKLNVKSLSVRAVTTVSKENLLLIGFQINKRMIIVQVKYTVCEKGVTVYPETSLISEYNNRTLQLCDFCYDSLNDRLLILNRKRSGKTYLQSVDRLKNLNSFNLCVKTLYSFNKPVNTFTHLYKNRYLFVYSCSTDNTFSYKIAKLKKVEM